MDEKITQLEKQIVGAIFEMALVVYKEKIEQKFGTKIDKLEDVFGLSIQNSGGQVVLKVNSTADVGIERETAESEITQNLLDLKRALKSGIYQVIETGVFNNFFIEMVGVSKAMRVSTFTGNFPEIEFDYNLVVKSGNYRDGLIALAKAINIVAQTPLIDMSGLGGQERIV